MSSDAKAISTVQLGLTHSLPLPAFPDEDIIAFGLQDKKQNVLFPTVSPEGIATFTCDVVTKPGSNGTTDFTGPFVHGTPGARFLYISWKRASSSKPPWVQRIKIPLGTIPGALLSKAVVSGNRLVADITGRRPHDTKPIAWSIQP